MVVPLKRANGIEVTSVLYYLAGAPTPTKIEIAPARALSTFNAASYTNKELDQMNSFMRDNLARWNKLFWKRKVI